MSCRIPGRLSVGTRVPPELMVKLCEMATKNEWTVSHCIYLIIRDFFEKKGD